ncbi:unnamed protein product [Adineta steineri]|uniref:Uncharacterized protein n=1 Tax=Adineta steineri TaxID=433720 RepID=A0A815NGK7_9BILA|nr:unnamed protein product [Adineta steineri]CAF3812781.1 unnamed protein product [Adineta steineri]
MIPSRFFRQQQQQQQNHKKKPLSSSSNDDDDETDDESNDNSFYHNPYHSGGQMNYADVPQQQYINENTYPTYLAHQQISEAMNSTSIDEQIHAKLMSLQQRGTHYSPYVHRQHDYAYRNQILPISHPASLSSIKKEKEENYDQENTNNIVDDEIPVYYPGTYPNQDENFDFASVVLWYRNVMQSVKKIM